MIKKRTALAALVVTGLIASTSSAAFANHGGGNGGRGEGNRGGGAIASLVTAGTINQTQADAFKAAMKIKLDAKFITKLNSVLTGLVSN